MEYKHVKKNAVDQSASYLNDDTTTCAPKLHMADRRPYRSPEMVVVGRAIELVRSYSSGKYSDGYTGYYWER